ncbi:MAG: EthD domain-containing protein [Actinomycetes bacterium]
MKIVAVARDPDRPDDHTDLAAAAREAGATAVAVYRPHPDGTDVPDGPDGPTVVHAWFPDVPTSDPCPTPDLTRWFGGRVDAYLVDERVVLPGDLPRTVGAPTPGIVHLPFVRRARSLSRAAMAEHWQRVHAPLVPEHQPGVVRYVQNVVRRPLTPDAPEVDGMAQLHFRTVADLHERFHASAASRDLLGADVDRFLDRTAGWRIRARETWILG